MTPALEIRSRIRSYPVLETDTLAQAIAGAPGGCRALWLVDANVRRAYPAELKALAGEVVELEASEQAKSFAQVGPLIEEILARGFRRDWKLVAVGGGVTQDIAAFACSILFRGARWSLIPSTLLAQCDSCIGSKSSINIGRWKNQLGTFYPPDQVLLCPALLGSLPDEAIVSGLGEVIKLHLIAGEAPFQALRATLDEGALDSGGLRPSRQALREMAWASLRIKQAFIEEDELDAGVRNLLNYGHTFGHALESATGYALPHGIGVLLGIDAATFFSARLGWVADDYARELQQWLGKYFRPHLGLLRRVQAQEVLSAMKLDKKNTGDGITCILTRGAGAMHKHTLERQAVRELLAEWLQELA